jgi:hypothetical protein
LTISLRRTRPPGMSQRWTCSARDRHQYGETDIFFVSVIFPERFGNSASRATHRRKDFRLWELLDSAGSRPKSKTVSVTTNPTTRTVSQLGKTLCLVGFCGAAVDQPMLGLIAAVAPHLQLTEESPSVSQRVAASRVTAAQRAKDQRGSLIRCPGPSNPRRPRDRRRTCRQTARGSLPSRQSAGPDLSRVAGNSR